MVLGEFEFDDLWNNSSSSSSGVSQTFTMLLLTGVIVLGTIIMINLIVAIIITDIDWLKKISQQQVLRNKVIIIFGGKLLKIKKTLRRITSYRLMLWSPC